MYRKTLMLTLCAVMLLILTTASLAESDWTAPTAGSAFSLEGDMGLCVGGNWFPILNYFDDAGLKGALGDPIDMLAAPSCAFKGDDKEFTYDGISIYTNPLGDQDVWYEAYITGGDWTTTRGIGIGSSREEVLAAYGEGHYGDSEDYITWSVSGDPRDFASPCITFTFENDAVTCVDIYYPTNTL